MDQDPVHEERRPLSRRGVAVVPAVRIAIAVPATGQSALPAPTRPSAKVQMVSTQPELPVHCCTTQAPAIRIASETAMAASAPRYRTVMQNPKYRGWKLNPSKNTLETKPGFSVKFP